MKNVKVIFFFLFLDYPKMSFPFEKMSIKHKQQECSQLFKTRIFFDVNEYLDEISQFKYLINEESKYDIKEKNIRVSKFFIKSYNCFSSEHFSFSFSLNHEYVDEKYSYYPVFAYSTHKTTKFSTMFAYIEPNPILLENNVEKMEKELYENYLREEDIYKFYKENNVMSSK